MSNINTQSFPAIRSIIPSLSDYISPFTIIIDGVTYDKFTSYKISRHIYSMSGSFQLIGSFQDFETFPIKVGDTIKILIHNEPFLNGFIESLSANTDDSIVTISGRDKTADVIDSSIITQVNYQNNISLKNVIQRLLEANSIKGIDVIDNAKPDNFTEEEVVEGEIGESLFTLINRYASKRQVLISTDGNGNLTIERGADEGKAYVSSLIRRQRELDPAINRVANVSISGKGNKSTRENNILSSSMTYSHSKRFNKYIVKAQENANAITSILKKINPEKSTNLTGEVIDNEIRESRALVILEDTSSTGKTVQDRALWEANLRKTKGFSYNCKVQGFKPQKDDELWKPNRLINVEDVKRNVNSRLLINKVSFSYDEENGSITELDLTYVDSFKLKVNQTLRNLQLNQAGNNTFKFPNQGIKR